MTISVVKTAINMGPVTMRTIVTAADCMKCTFSVTVY